MTTDTHQSLFAELETVIRVEEHTDVDLMDIIGGFAKTSPDVAHAIAMHARDILGTSTDTDVSYTDIICECYRRTFFDPEMSARYRTDFISKDLRMLRQFVDYMKTMNDLPEGKTTNVLPFARSTAHH